MFVILSLNKAAISILVSDFTFQYIIYQFCYGLVEEHEKKCFVTAAGVEGEGLQRDKSSLCIYIYIYIYVHVILFKEVWDGWNKFYPSYTTFISTYVYHNYMCVYIYIYIYTYFYTRMFCHSHRHGGESHASTCLNIIVTRAPPYVVSLTLLLILLV